MSILPNNLNIDQVCGNCGAWECDPFGKGWIGNCPFDQVPYAFTKKCENDRWVRKYHGIAIKSYHKYADQMFIKGKSVSQNLALAHMWFSLASSKGHADAVKQIQELESKMTLSEIKEAKESARNWKPLE
jgi:hypothetical protein